MYIQTCTTNNCIHDENNNNKHNFTLTRTARLRWQEIFLDHRDVGNVFWLHPVRDELSS